MKEWDEIVETLAYVNYACQRDLNPEIPPERWAAMGFKDVPTLEARYQAELAITKAQVSAGYPL